MFRMISRKEALQNPVLAYHIELWQKRMDPSQNPYEPGMFYDDERKKSRYFDKSETDAMNQAALDEYNKKRDDFSGPKINPSYQKQAIFELPEEKIRAESIRSLYETATGDITFILDYRIPWLSQEHDHIKVKRAKAWFEVQGVDKNFEGAFLVEKLKIEQFLPKLFWITKSCAALPYCWFAHDQVALVGNICWIGNLHLSFYSKQAHDMVLDWSRRIELKELSRC